MLYGSDSFPYIWYDSWNVTLKYIIALDMNYNSIKTHLFVCVLLSGFTSYACILNVFVVILRGITFYRCMIRGYVT
jgi:hypothetical protein